MIVERSGVGHSVGQVDVPVIGLPLMRVVCQAKQVGDGAVEGDRHFWQFRHVESGAVLETGQCAVRGHDPHASESGDDLLLGEAKFAPPLAQPLGYAKLPASPSLA
jgi:hypothetical protein